MSGGQPLSERGRSTSAETDEITPLAREISSFSMSQACIPAAEVVKLLAGASYTMKSTNSVIWCASGREHGDECSDQKVALAHNAALLPLDRPESHGPCQSGVLAAVLNKICSL